MDERRQAGTDEELMQAHARGDEAAFSELVRRWSGRLFGYLNHMTADRELALDLVQETFIRAHGARGRFDPSRSFRAWIFRIATRLHADHRRSWWGRLTRRTVSLFAGEEAEMPVWAERLAGDPADEPARAVETRDAAARIRAEVSRLPEPYRRAILLHDLEGLTAGEIAGICGRPTGTVLSWLSRGRAMLRDRLESAGGMEAWR